MISTLQARLVASSASSIVDPGNGSSKSLSRGNNLYGPCHFGCRVRGPGSDAFDVLSEAKEQRFRLMEAQILAT